MNADGSSPTRLTDDKSRTAKLPDFSPVYDASPAWSPDGTKIAFISNRDYLFSLYVMNADGSNSRLVTDRVIDMGEPAWSPDGGKIAFSAGARGSIGSTKPQVDIYVVNVDGSGLLKLTEMNADGSNLTNITNRGKYVFNSGQATYMDGQADWQPLPAPTDFGSSVVGFSTSSYTFYEDVGKAQITVTRTRNLKDVASFVYATVTLDLLIQYPDPASTGTVRFAPGESSKTISFPLVDYRGLLRSTEYKIILSDNVGNATFLGGIKEATFTVLGKDPASRTKSPN
mgnify:CR=1 FL=1